MKPPREHRPGDIILDRYGPHLSPEEREAGRERLYAYVRWHLRVLMRQVREEMDSCNGDSRDTLDPTCPSL